MSAEELFWNGRLLGVLVVRLRGLRPPSAQGLGSLGAPGSLGRGETGSVQGAPLWPTSPWPNDVLDIF